MDDDELQDSRNQKVRFPRRRGPGGLLVFLIIGVFALILFQYGKNFTGQGKVLKTETGHVLSLVEEEANKPPERRALARIVIEGEEITLYFKEGKPFEKGGEKYQALSAYLPQHLLKDSDGALVKKFMQALDRPENFQMIPPNYLLRDFIVPLIPWVVLFILVWFFFFRQLRSAAGTGNVLNFGRSRARFVSPEKVNVTFNDVAGVEEAKEEVKELVEFLKNPKKFRRLGGRIPRGILFVGPPGTGKTLLAKAIAGEAGVPFFSISGSDFVEMFVGVGAARVRDLFRQAREHSPAIIFLDEIDAVGRRRGSGLGGGHDEREQTLNQILVEMDGFDTDENVIIIAATNRPDILDPALLRPGRFDRQVVIDLPDVKGREAILKVHAKKIKLGPNVDLSVIAKTTPGASGADLAAIVNESAIIGTMRGKDFVGMEELEEARDKVIYGRERKSRVLDEKERKVTAYHEGGHALVAALLAPVAHPVHKVTIIPRGMALGATMQLPEKDSYMMHKSFLEATITVLFGGRVAEEVVFGDISSGARDDIHKASQIARSMVCEYGMSEVMGPVSYQDPEEHLFLGREITRTRAHSDETAKRIDAEVRKIIDTCYSHARDLITQNRDRLDKIAMALLKYEVLTGQEIKAILQGEDIEALRNGQLLKK